jgi:hypothetical protein
MRRGEMWDANPSPEPYISPLRGNENIHEFQHMGNQIRQEARTCAPPTCSMCHQPGHNCRSNSFPETNRKYKCITLLRQNIM